MTTSAAVVTSVVSIRISSGASWRYEKPRSPLSNWCEETPRSNSAPDNSAIPASSIAASRSSNRRCCNMTRSPYGARRSRDAARAAGSRSRPRTLSPGCASRIAVVWPAPPRVASRTKPCGTPAKSSVISRTITGSCEKVAG